MSRPSFSEILDPLGLIAGMFDELGIGDVLDQATQQTPETRFVTVGTAVKAMVLNGLGFVNQQLYLVPRFFQNKPTQRLVAPGIDAAHLNDDAWGRALDTLYAYGVTALYRLIAATAAERLGLAPRFTHLASPSFHVDGRYNSEEDPDAHVIPITRGYSRDHRPDLNQVMLALMVEQQAGIPVLMKPLSGNSSAAQDFGEVIRTPIDQLQTTYGATYLVADSALYSADNLQKLARTPMKWSSRVPATLREAQAGLAHAEPQTMVPLLEGYHAQTLTSTYGGVEQRWLLGHSARRRMASQRTVEKQWFKQSTQESQAFQKLCRTTFACEAAAQQALAAFAQELETTVLHRTTIHPLARYAKRGRPGHDASPEQMVYQSQGALAASLAAREARLTQQSCFIRATNELDETLWSPQELLTGYKGQGYTERGFRFLKAPQFLAASLSLKKPQRIMALLMVMTGCLLLYAALEYRMRKALVDHGETFPHQTGKPIQNPTARWVFHYFVGIHLLRMPGEGAMVLNLNDEPRKLLRLLGKPYEGFYS